MFALTLDAFRVFFKRPWPLREFLQVSWFIVSVSIVPVILVSIAFGATVALQVGNVSRQLGAQSQTGAAMVLAVVRARRGANGAISVRASADGLRGAVVTIQPKKQR